MIQNILHKGIRELFENGQSSKLQKAYIGKIRRLLLRLQSASELKDLKMPGSHFHELKGNHKGYFALDVNRNYRLVFRFENGDAYDVDYMDYH